MNAYRATLASLVALAAAIEPAIIAELASEVATSLHLHLLCDGCQCREVVAARAALPTVAAAALIAAEAQQRAELEAMTKRLRKDAAARERSNLSPYAIPLPLTR
jgi:hypothetical protein